MKNKTIEYIYYLIKGTAATFFSFFLNQRKMIIITSTNNVSFNFNSKYFFDYLIEKHSNECDFYYIINDEKKRKDLNKLYPHDPERFIETKSIKGMLFALKANIWISSTFELPVLSLLINRKRVVFHLGHGIPLKKIGLCEEKITKIQYLNRYIRTRQFNYVVCYSDSFKKNMEDIFRNKSITFLSFGQPRNDFLCDRDLIAREAIGSVCGNINVNSKLCLYAPTWRPYESTKILPFNDFNYSTLCDYLELHDIYIFIRSHPFYPVCFPEKFEFNERIINLSSSVINEIIDVLPGFDSLITDYSSIYLDYLSLGRKVGFIPYDFKQYSESVGFSISFDDITPGSKIYTQSDLIDFFQQEQCMYEKQREKVSDFLNIKCKGNSDEIYSYLNEKGCLNNL